MVDSLILSLPMRASMAARSTGFARHPLTGFRFDFLFLATRNTVEPSRTGVKNYLWVRISNLGSEQICTHLERQTRRHTPDIQPSGYEQDYPKGEPWGAARMPARAGSLLQINSLFCVLAGVQIAVFLAIQAPLPLHVSARPGYANTALSSSE